MSPSITCCRCVEELALQLKPSVSSALSRPMQRKLVTLINCQVVIEDNILDFANLNKIAAA